MAASGADLLKRAAFEIAPQLLKFARRLDEIRINRIKLLDSREMGRFVLPNEGAFRHQSPADPSADRGADNRVVEVELGSGDIGLPRGDVGLRLAPASPMAMSYCACDATCPLLNFSMRLHCCSA